MDVEVECNESASVIGLIALDWSIEVGKNFEQLKLIELEEWRS